MKSEVIVALDVPETAAIGPLVDRLPDAIRYYKVGLELYCADGLAALEPLKSRGRHIFLDLKLHDIPRTVERAVRAASRHGVELLTIHASGGPSMLRAAAEAARECGPARPRLLAVTVLTSLDRNDLQALGVNREPRDQVYALAEMALQSGIDGLVCSAQESAELRKRFGPDPILVTPGIRLPSDVVGDQKRVTTPRDAVLSGATFLVVGRPIVESPDPAAAARRVLEDMAAAG